LGQIGYIFIYTTQALLTYIQIRIIFLCAICLCYFNLCIFRVIKSNIVYRVTVDCWTTNKIV